jgi:chorismate mutase
MYTTDIQRERRMEETNYYVIKKKAVPEVLLKVLEVQKLLDSQKALSILEAAEMVGISRSSYYKYKDDIFPFYASKRGKNITFVIELNDQPGVIASILKIFAVYDANILTIHQSVPINGKGLLTVSVDIVSEETNISAMIQEVEHLDDVSYVKIIAME